SRLFSGRASFSARWRCLPAVLATLRSSRRSNARCSASTSSIFASSSGASRSSPGSSTKRRNAAPEKRLVVARGKPGGGARLMVEGRLHRAFEVAPHPLAERLLWDEAPGAAGFVEPGHSGRDVSDLIAIDAAQDSGAVRIADALERRRHRWCHVE